MQYRQGDVLLVHIEAMPAKAARRPASSRLVLAEGEVTGHAHVAMSDSEIVEAFLADLNGETYLSAPAGATIRHEEHGPVTVPRGTYKVVRQREYTPQAVRNVAD